MGGEGKKINFIILQSGKEKEVKGEGEGRRESASSDGGRKHEANNKERKDKFCRWLYSLVHYFESNAGFFFAPRGICKFEKPVVLFFGALSNFEILRTISIYFCCCFSLPEMAPREKKGILAPLYLTPFHFQLLPS